GYLQYQQAFPNVWNFVLSAPNANAYIGIGFSPDGNMVGSDAVVGWVGSDGIGNVKAYYLGGQAPSSVTLLQSTNQGFQVGNSSVGSDSQGLHVAFQITAAGTPSKNVIYAVGTTGTLPSGPNYQLSQHLDRINTVLNYSTGQFQQSGGNSYSGLLQAHGLLNLLGWTILLPIGAVAARYFREWDPLWYYSHMAFQLSGFLLGVSGVISGFVLEDRLNASVGKHKAIGIIVLVIGILQATALLIRPEKGSKSRKYWNLFHQNGGRVLILLAVSNVFYGINLGGAGRSWNVGFSVALAVLFGISLVLELRMWF
ncbi:hypothetical protein M569_17098, partial [Genlisea aurea]